MDGGDMTRYEVKGLNEGILLNRNEWRKLTYVSDPA